MIRELMNENETLFMAHVFCSEMLPKNKIIKIEGFRALGLDDKGMHFTHKHGTYGLLEDTAKEQKH